VNSKLLHVHEGQRTFALVFNKGEDVHRALLEFAEANRITGAQFTAIGAFGRAMLGYFDPTTKKYKEIPIEEQVEVVSLIGNLTRSNGEPRLHAHAVLGKSDGIAYGGHLLGASVWPTLEVMLVESPQYLQRKLDDETGLALIDLAA
jgi:predicted DNA-binding protein with PD1-like motif